MNTVLIKKVAIIGLISVSVLIAIYVIYRFVFGSVTVNVANENVRFRVDGGAPHEGSSKVSWITPGKHTITVEGDVPSDYTPQTYDVTVGSGQGVTSEIELKPTVTNPDAEGDTFDPNGEASIKLQENLPLINEIGSISFDYSENEYQVELLSGITHEKAIAWFKAQGLTDIEDSVILWGKFIPPDEN